ncbi:MAG: DNA polymerase III subunit delta [Gammaproteobacteria bacterium]|nr:DNA polymerase III subunit delta [Gammaproteobacteria bacterium]
MKVELQELSRKLQASGAQNLPKIILINGNEALLIEEALDQLRSALQSMGFAERLKYQLEAGFDWSQLTGVGAAMSLFSERRLIEFRVPKSLGAPGTKALTEYCNNPPVDDLLVVIMPALDKRQRQAKWAKLVESTGWMVDCYDISAQQFPAWLKQRLQSRSLRIEGGVIELLCQQLEGNVLAAAQEIDKLQVLAENGAVTLQLVKDSLADQARFDVYALSDVCLAGDFARAVRIKNRLQSEGVEPVIVVWALVREIRTLAQLSAALQAGQNRAQLFQQLRIWRKREPLVNAALHRLSASQFAGLLQQAAQLDQTVKGQRAAVGSLWHQIEQLCAELCNVALVPKAS